MQNQNNSNNTNKHYNVTKQLSPLGYFVVGIIGIILLVLFGRLLLLLAVIGGIGWLAWKFRWAIRYYYGRFIGMVNTHAQAYQQKCQKGQSSQQYYSAQYTNPFQTSRQYQPNQTINSGWNTGATAPTGRRNAIFDVTPDKEDN